MRTAVVLVLVAAVAVASAAAMGVDVEEDMEITDSLDLTSANVKPDPWKGLRQVSGKGKGKGKTPGGCQPCGTGWAECVAIPAVNGALTSPSAAYQQSIFGPPGCKYIPTPQGLANAKVKKNLLTMKVGGKKFSLTGVKPFIEAVNRALEAMKASGNADAVAVYNEVKGNGAGVCRCIAKGKACARKSGGWSNHSWGLAADFYFGCTADKRGDHKAQKGLTVMAPFMRKERLYWGGEFKRSEDAMHWEASKELVEEWKSKGLLKL